MEQFALKPTLYYGPDALSALEALDGKRVLLVTDAFLVKSGLADKVTARLRGGAVEVFDRVVPDPPLDLVAEGVRRYRAFRPEAMVAFGGGSPMDCAKGIRHFAGAEGEAPCPLWCVPTTAGTGSEVTAFAVLTDTGRGVKYPLVDDALIPEAAVLDASLLAGVPPAVTADTGMDVLAHAAEAVAATGSSPFSEAMAEKAFHLALQNLPEAHRTMGEARERMLLASCLAGVAFNAAGLGICHSLAHALGGRYHVPHGRLNAMLLPFVIRYNASDRGAAGRYAALAHRCGLAGNARALASALQRLRVNLGMPGRLTECGVERESVLADLDQIAAAALADVCTPGNPRAPAAEDLKAIVREIL